MTLFEQHEQFEIEVLEALKNARILESLVFGGETMLRLCHELPRYSVDLEFWKIKPMNDNQFLEKLKTTLSRNYELTDAQVKHFTILVELRSPRFPKRLKIEIRREIKDWNSEMKIAFSQTNIKQVLLKAHTLQQAMENKIAAFLNRSEIRDAFDMEFLLRRGIPLPSMSEQKVQELLTQVQRFKQRDFKVTLGSIIESELRAYYVENGFRFLLEKLQSNTAVR